MSPAKLNLYLNVVGKYKNGFHKLESIVTRISLCDEIFIGKNNSGEIKFYCSKKELENNNNLCVKAAELLKKKYKLSGVDMFLKKQIPVGAGLGGASSNAAYTLIGINDLFNLKLNNEQLFKLGAKLGSDVNFFISRVSYGLMEQKGEKIIPLDIAKKYRFLLVYPNIELSTKAVYKALNAKLTKHIDNVNILSYALKKKDYLLMEKASFNCLEKSAFSLCSGLKKVKKIFEERGLFCLMTGSGSSFFTYNQDKRKLSCSLKGQALVNQLKHQGWEVFEVQTY